MNSQANYSLIVFGNASQKVVKTITIPPQIPGDLSLMDFLRASGITIASSCGGVGGCQKCLVNGTLISCQISLKLFVEKYPLLRVEISYL
jgi:Na+-transporting NADH:ubiquinone oxidoreductase subunit NqrF